MCWFVTVAVPAAREPELRAALRSSFGLLPTANRAILDHLPADWVAAHVVTGMCSCDLYGDPTVPEPDLEGEIERFRERHRKPSKRKRGWTDTRIEQAVAALRARRQRAPPRLAGLRADLAQQLGAGPVAVVVHAYSGDVDREDPVRETADVDVLGEVRPDVLYRVRGRS